MNKSRFVLSFVVVCLAAAAVVLLADYDQGFETDIVGWDVFGGAFNAVRVASGTGGVTSSDGAWHAEDCGAGADDPGAATSWGGYACNDGCAAIDCAAGLFQPNGYLTSVDIYLDVDGGWANDTRFDWTSAIGMPDGNHRRDFVFNGGFYDDDLGPGAGTDRFVFSASNNATRSGAFPKNPGRDPIVVDQTGWYTFQHRFRNDGLGVLSVELSIYDDTSTLVHMWVLSDPTDLIDVTVGGNRYGWFAINEFGCLQYDVSFLRGCEPPLSVELDAFTVEPTRDGVLVRWSTVWEKDNVGFRVLRYEPGRNKGPESLTQAVIPAEGTELHGGHYELVDPVKAPNRVLHYYLEDVDVHGNVYRHGPVILDLRESKTGLVRPAASKR